jgi:regulator of cell morphogenesis and NO signaling
VTTIDPTQTVADITLRIPAAARAFERLGIDYCCRGKIPLSEACSALQLPLEEVLASLTEAAEGRPASDIPSNDASALIDLILDRHHAFARQELTRLLPLAGKVLRVHGQRHPELQRVYELLSLLEADLLPHMLKEEQVLFPYIRQLPAGAVSRPPFVTVQNPIRMMHLEHEQVGEVLAELRGQTAGFTPPADACGSFRALYAGVQELVADTYQHVHLENNLLFPLAEELEAAALRA